MNKARITIRLDKDVLECFQGGAQGKHGYQTRINTALRTCISKDEQALLRNMIRGAVKEALYDNSVSQRLIQEEAHK